MGNWLSTVPGLSSVDTVQIPSGQRDDNCHGGEETEGKGRKQAVVSYSGAQPWGLEAENNSTTNAKTGRPAIVRQPTRATLLPSTHDQPTSSSLFSPIWPTDSAYGTGPITASYCPETPQTSVAAERPPVSFADNDVVIPPSRIVDPAKLYDEDGDTVIETCSESSDEFVTALPVRQKATSTRLHRRMLPRRRDTVQHLEFFDSTEKDERTPFGGWTLDSVIFAHVPL